MDSSSSLSQTNPTGQSVPPSKKGTVVSNRGPEPGQSPPRKRIRTAVGEASSSSSKPKAATQVKKAEVPTPINRVCRHCGHPTMYLARHIAASKTCRRRHALYVQQLSQTADLTIPTNSRRPNDPPEDDIYSDLPLDEQPPYEYDIDHDYRTIQRLRDIGILPDSGYDLAPRLQEVQVPSVKTRALTVDLDLLMQDMAPHDEDDASDAGDFDADPFVDPDDEDPLPPPLAILPPPLNENLPLPKHHIADDLYANDLYGLKYTSNRAGQPILVDGNRPKKCGDAYQEWEKAWKLKEGECPFRPFQNLMEWEICQWAMLSGPTKLSADWLLNIPTVCRLISWVHAISLTNTYILA